MLYEVRHPEKLLRVAKSMQDLLVVGMALSCRLLFGAHAASS